MKFVDFSDDYKIYKSIGHKYIRREGTPGNYTYIYEEKKDGERGAKTDTQLDVKDIRGRRGDENFYITIDIKRHAPAFYQRHPGLVGIYNNIADVVRDRKDLWDNERRKLTPKGVGAVKLYLKKIEPDEKKKLINSKYYGVYNHPT